MEKPISSLDIIAGEYPPRAGGVSDYTQEVARGLAMKGELIRVWQEGIETEPITDSAGVIQHRYAGDFTGAGLHRLGHELDRIPGQRRLLIQYVPHAFGCRGMNTQFANWVRTRAETCKDDVRIMFHEVAYPWVKWPLKHNLIAAVNRWMAYTMIRNASKLYVSTTAWTDHLVRLGARRDLIELLAIPSNIPTSDDNDRIRQVRSSLLQPGIEFVIGHFGTYGRWVTQSLRPILEKLLQQQPNVHVLLLGGGSLEFRADLINEHPSLAARVTATGRIGSVDVASHIRACDVMLQPFPDGANTRRTSLMACLINSVATVSNIGHNTEPIWKETGAVALAPSITPDLVVEHIATLLEREGLRSELAKYGNDAYNLHFQLSRTIEKLMA